MPVADYLEAKIWQPMGAEFDGSWSLDSEGGLEKLESGINARPIDFAKLGQLYLDGGVGPDGSAVVPADWVELSMQPTDGVDRTAYYPTTFDRPFGSVSHHMFWWQIEMPDGRSAFSAVGNHGQFIFVSPSERIVIVRNGETYGIGLMAWLELFTEASDSPGPTLSNGDVVERDVQDLLTGGVLEPVRERREIFEPAFVDGGTVTPGGVDIAPETLIWNGPEPRAPDARPAQRLRLHRVG